MIVMVMDLSATANERDDEKLQNNFTTEEPAPNTDQSSRVANDNNTEIESFEKTEDEERPSKRRRVTDTSTPQRSTSRAVSPPWKKHGAEGPTTFLVDGKRKSARFNTLPLELQPQGEKRATRASVNHTPNVKSKYSSIQQAKPSTPASVSKSATSKTLHSRSLSTSIQPSKPSPSKKPITSAKSSRRADPVRGRSTGQRTPSPSRRRYVNGGKGHRNLYQKKKQVNGTPHSQHEDSQAVTSSDGDEESETESETFAVPYTPDPNQKPQRLRLKFNMATPKAQHPAHVDPARKYKSFREWIDTEGPLYEGEVSNHMTNEEIRYEAGMRRKVDLASRPGGLLEKVAPRIGDEEREVEHEPPRQYTRHDFTVAHALRFRLLLEREQKKHIGNAKKYAYDARSKWRASQPKSEQEIEAENLVHYDAIMTATKKQCVQDLLTKWNMFRQEVYNWRLERWKEEQDALGKENLKRVIEESKALLDQRLLDNSEDSASENEVSSEVESNDDGDVEDNMSSDGGGSEEERSGNSDDDLTAEQLQQKYNQHSEDGEDSPKDIDMLDASIADEEEDVDDYHMRGLDFEDKDVKAKIAQAQADESQADLSEDESTDMDSESDIESEEDESAEDSNDPEQESLGLAALLGGSSKPNVVQSDQDHIKDHDTLIPTTQDIEITSEIQFDMHQVPDAAQVQTPVSNNEAPMNLRKDIEHSPNDKASGLRIASTNDADDGMALAEGDRDVRADSHMSMPATPISVDLERKQIPTLEVPHLLRATLREYQKDGFNWLADRYEHGANSILADEMGLGKTIQTITLLAHLALKHGIWGPHLIVVPTSVILNWEMEFKKFLPSFKVLSYYGSPDERKAKRAGWLDDDRWNVIITSYNLVVSDQHSFKRRGWHYFILDEAHNIKNFRSLRWQTLLTFRSHSRLLLTGTPLQNNLEELWSLLFFLVGKDKAEDFLGRQEFALLFKKPADQILEDDQQHLDVEAQEQVHKLHQILRPRLLRRLKADVEKQMPGKYEHVVYCRLSKRQRFLYDGFLSRSQTRETLARGNYLSIINCLMQLRKVCNHPDLFETRPIVTSFAMPRSIAAEYEIRDLFVRRNCLQDRSQMVDLDVVDLLPGANGPVSALDTIQKARLNALFRLRELVYYQSTHAQIKKNMTLDGSTAMSTLHGMNNKSKSTVLGDLQHRVYLTSLRSQQRPLYSHSLAQRLIIPIKSFPEPSRPKRRADMLDWYASHSTILEDMVKNLDRRAELMQDYLIKYTCTTPAVVTPDLFELTFGKPAVQHLRQVKTRYTQDIFKEPSIRQAIAFPDKRLLQFDCGKLQKLDALLRTLQAGGHRALIFTQMTKILDILEQFLNIHGHRYLRLDGSTKIENRQLLTERFNTDPSILVFILSSRSGGLGINLTGADTVIFYDLDWNPAMDKQCQDRAHRIGQTRDVHIYRFVSEHTIEANILRKSNQKRLLDNVIIQEGDFTTDYFNKPSNPQDLFDDPSLQDAAIEASAAFDRVLGMGNTDDATTAKMLGQAEDREDVAAARIAEKEVEKADEGDFDDKGSGSNKNTRPSSRQGLSSSQNGSGNTGTTTLADLSHSNAWITGEIAPRTDMAVDIFKEKPPVGVDRHMVEFLEWENKDVPFVPPEVKKKKRNDDHRVRRKNR